MSKFFKQHEDALSLINEIEKKVNNPVTTPRELSEALIGFSARLKHHLTMEDMYLYPKAAACTNDELKILASKLQSEMTPISQAFSDYIFLWGPKQIDADRDKFNEATKGICNAVRARIANEEAKFYKMAETVL